MRQCGSKSWRVELLFQEKCDLADGFCRISNVLEDLDTFLDAIPGLDKRGKADLRLVCDEIGSNAIRHSTPEKPIRLIIEANAMEDSVQLRIMDNGREFNPLTQAKKPYIGSELGKRTVGGLGLYLIHELFPLTSYRRSDDWNIFEVTYIMGKDGWKKMQRSANLHR